ncbi:MAG TPA: PaaI family thioesterase [Rhodospirillales bacterium]|nr:PaaI family thioesterase [Rhodospirillales bacterium]
MTDTPETANLDQLREIFSAIPHCRELGLKIVSLEPGSASIKLEYQDRLIANPETGVVHGGVISTLLDTVSGLSAMSAISETTPVATLDLRIDYLRPATPGRAIIGAAECFRLTNSVAFIRGAAHHDDDSDPIAHSMGTFMLGAAGFTSEKKKQT